MRIFLIRALFLLFLFTIAGRLFYWQIVRGAFLQSQADNQHFSDTKLDAVRGNIFFSDRSVLTSSNPSFTLYGLPKEIVHDQKIQISYTLAKILSESQDNVDPDSIGVDSLAKDLVNKLEQDLYWVPIKKNISIDQKKQIEKLNSF